LKEELGLTTDVKYLFTLDFKSAEVKHKVHVFLTNFDGEIKIYKEFKWIGWMTTTEVDKLLNENKLCLDTAELYKKYIKIK
jgi:hypothetical protein